MQPSDSSQYGDKDFVACCRERGIKPTHQRTEIYRALMATEEHPSAETLYNAVKERVPTISLDTVYRTLRLFEEKGLVARVSTAGDSMRFDGNINRHHHFVCVECHKVRDFYDDDFDRLNAPQTISRLGEINSVHVELRGVCNDCQGKKMQKI